MTLATLRDVLPPANAQGYAVPGFVCLGWEDMRAYVAAAEAEAHPVILQAGPSCRAHTPLPVLSAMMRHLGEGASVPVVVHLDHGTSADECAQALEEGFTSVMFDGSRLPLAENIAQTRAIADLAHARGASCEGEIGFVGYAGGAASAGTDPIEAAAFAAETGVDAVAVSVGNTHLQTDQSGGLDEARIAEIAARTDVPLVIHGGSGVPHAQRQHLAQSTTIAKYNIGTEMRQVFGRALRARLDEAPEMFDRVEILSAVHDPLVQAARRVIQGLKPTSG